MKRMLFLTLAAVAATAACGGSAGPSSSAVPSGPPTTSSNPGAANPRLALKTFMDAMAAQNLDEIALIWGSEKGPARDIVDPKQLGRREMIMQCYFQHDSYKILADVETKEGVHAMTIQLTRGAITRETKTQVVLGPNDRWFVASPELQPLKDLCSEQDSQR